MTEKRTRPNAGRPGTGKLRLYWLAYNVALETDVQELLENLEVQAYTRWDGVKGRGRSGPHLDDEVWPAVNALYVFAAPATLEPKLAAEIQRLRARYPGEGIKCLVQPCLEIH
jgi:hypothetical protein